MVSAKEFELIICGNWIEFQKYRIKHRDLVKHVRYVSSESDLQGWPEGTRVIFCGTYWRNMFYFSNPELCHALIRQYNYTVNREEILI